MSDIGGLGDSEHVSMILKVGQAKGSRVNKKPTEDGEKGLGWCWGMC